MNMCRTCLKTPADKHIEELENGIKEGNKNSFEIMMFCLDIEITQDSKVTSNLCSTCYRKIISFFKFKALSLKNDSYLKSLEPAVRLEDLEDQKLSVYVDENGIKHENLLDSDEFGPCEVDCETEFKKEVDVDCDNSYEDLVTDIKDHDSYEDEQIDIKNENIIDNVKVDLELPSVKLRDKYRNYEGDTKEKAPKKPGRRKKEKLQKKEKWKPERQVCEECGMSVLNLKEHSLQHRPKEQRQRLQCKACPKTFLTIGGRKKHYLVTHLGFKSKCDICGKEVANVGLHKIKVHNPSALRYGCVQCERRFVAQSALDTHMVTHTKDQAFECDQCKKRFSSKNCVGRHIRLVHQKIRSHQCPFCSKAYMKKERLQAHVRWHTNDRPYKCEDCGKAFSMATYLKTHRLTHSDVKSYQCQHCGMKFAKHGTLWAHMVKHTKEKRYPCGFCGVRFGRSDHRNRHELTAHKKRAVD